MKSMALGKFGRCLGDKIVQNESDSVRHSILSPDFLTEFGGTPPHVGVCDCLLNGCRKSGHGESVLRDRRG
jgi:hypothetical protein